MTSSRDPEPTITYLLTISAITKQALTKQNKKGEYIASLESTYSKWCLFHSKQSIKIQNPKVKLARTLGKSQSALFKNPKPKISKSTNSKFPTAPHLVDKNSQNLNALFKISAAAQIPIYPSHLPRKFSVLLQNVESGKSGSISLLEQTHIHPSPLPETGNGPRSRD